MQNTKIAVTGGIGSGKSTVAELLRSKGLPVFSCDEIYHKLIKQKDYLAAIEARFPNTTKDGKLLKATVQEKEIEDNKDYTVATIDYLADGNDGLTPFINADKRECPDGLTLRGLFLDYVRQQTAAGKKITSKLDGRITVVPASDRK